jgi:long-chain acyl-CoA synthetase
MATKIYEVLEATAERLPNKISFRRRIGNEFKGKTFLEIKSIIDNLIAGFVDIGVKSGDKIIYFCDSSVNWILGDLAIQAAGAVSVPRGTDVTADDIVYIATHSEGTIAIVQRKKDKLRLESLKERIPLVQKIYILEDEMGELARGEGSIGEIIERGKSLLAKAPDTVKQRVEAVNPSLLATLIYTSGTTGQPKGVMLNQTGWINAVEMTIEKVGLNSNDSGISLLPPWHAFERAIEYAVIKLGIDFLITDSKTLKEDLVAFKPTMFPSVPRIWEALYNGIMAKIKKESTAKQGIFQLALKIGKTWADNQAMFNGYDYTINEPNALESLIKKASAGATLAAMLPLKAFADAVFKPIHNALGGKLRISVSAGSALPSVVDNFLTSIGLLVLEGYGMTETSAVISVRDGSVPTAGTLGTVLNGYEIKLKQENGTVITKEFGKKGTLWVKSKQILQGYYKRPELTQELFDSEGFFNTGDLMTINWRGQLSFTGRSKDTLVLAGGENVEPLPIEDKLLQSEYIDQIVVVGNEKKTLGAIIVPHYEHVKAAIANIPTDTKEWNSHEPIRSFYKKEISNLISKQNGFKSFEIIPGNCFYLSPRNFDPDTEMTRTMKVKRNIVLENFKQEIEAMFK